MLVLIFCITRFAMAADDPEIRVAVGAEEIYIGETVEYAVEIRNSKNPSAPDMSAIKELFDVVNGGDESRNQSSIFIVNGRKSEQNVFSHVYHFHLTPKESGNLTIPSATATIDGKTLTSAPLSLKVIAAEQQDLVLVEIKTSHSRVYPTQPFTVTLRVLVQPLPNDAKADPLKPLRGQPPHLQINWSDAPAGLTAVEDKMNWMQPLLARDGIGFTLNDFNARTGSFFEGPRAAVFKLLKGRETRDGLDGSPINYFVYELTRKFQPEKAGDYPFGPALVKGMFVNGIERTEYSGHRLVAIAPAVSVEVREVPSPRPATFCGGIGDYRMAAAATPVSLRVGDPLTLTLEFERGEHGGSLDLISAPDLSAIPQLTTDFDLIDKSPTGRVEGSVKKFAYAMRPRRADVGIPTLKVSVFDPRTEQFDDVVTPAIPLQVTEASRITGGDLVGSLPTAGSTEIKTRAEGIYQNITDPSQVRDERVNLMIWTIAATVAWSLAGCVIAIVKVYRRKSSDAGWQRRQQARRTANRSLASARESLAQGKPQDALRHVRSALIGFIADMQNRVAGGLTAADAATALAGVSVSEQDRVAIVQLLESIESAEYGGNQTANASASIEEASRLIGRIAPQLDRSP